MDRIIIIITTNANFNIIITVNVNFNIIIIITTNANFNINNEIKSEMGITKRSNQIHPHNKLFKKYRRTEIKQN